MPSYDPTQHTNLHDSKVAPRQRCFLKPRIANQCLSVVWDHLWDHPWNLLWGNLVSSGTIWDQLESSGLIWDHLKWHCGGVLGTTWSSPGELWRGSAALGLPKGWKHKVQQVSSKPHKFNLFFTLRCFTKVAGQARMWLECGSRNCRICVLPPEEQTHAHVLHDFVRSVYPIFVSQLFVEKTWLEILSVQPDEICNLINYQQDCRSK